MNRHAEWRDQIPQLQIPMQVRETADFARQHQRLDMPLERITGRMPSRRRPAVSGGSALFQALGFHVTQRLGDPLRRVRFARAEEDFGRRLREHGLGIEPIPLRQLRPPLEAEDERAIALAGLRHGRVELRQPLEAGEFVDDKPRAPAGRLRLIHQAEHERIQPQTGERDESGARFRCGCEKQPATARRRPVGGAPALARGARRRQELQRVRHHVQGGQDTGALRAGRRVDHHGVGRAREETIEFPRVREPRDDLRGVGPMREQERHDAARRITEKGVLIRTFRKQGFRERERLGVHAKLVGRRPERRPAIEGIQNRIAAVRVEELRRVLERGIVDDRGLATFLHLQQQLTDERGLARPRVAHHEEVTRLDGMGHADPGGSRP